MARRRVGVVSAGASTALRQLSVTVLLAVGVVLLGPVALASAHAELISTDPAQGATVATAPAAVRLTFSEPIDQRYVRAAVTAPGGTAATVAATADGPTVTVPLAAAGPGAYRVEYRVVSADGHPVSGELRFTVAGSPSPTATAPSTTPSASRATSPATSPATTPAAAKDGVGSASGGAAGLGLTVAALIAVAVVGASRWRAGRR